jgi:hypothetical protein
MATPGLLSRRSGRDLVERPACGNSAPFPRPAARELPRAGLVRSKDDAQRRVDDALSVNALPLRPLCWARYFPKYCGCTSCACRPPPFLTDNCTRGSTFDAEMPLIEQHDTEHLGVTGHGKSQPQQYHDCEKQSAKGSRNYFKAESLALVRLFHR